ncbi:hypothetical protein V6N13_129914 [Hibiscus sabdariffa]|uniref:Uncharacterized protein n=1 Tax=Hibiscus sabdariffa TaxID=183260 RepID=A0ABR2SML2_9ROSI
MVEAHNQLLTSTMSIVFRKWRKVIWIVSPCTSTLVYSPDYVVVYNHQIMNIVAPHYTNAHFADSVRTSLFRSYPGAKAFPTLMCGC